MNISVQSIQDRIRQLLREQGTIAADLDRLPPDADLYVAGLNSLSSVDLMLAVEQKFNFVFPDDALNRRTFASINAIASTVERLTASSES